MERKYKLMVVDPSWSDYSKVALELQQHIDACVNGEEFRVAVLHPTEVERMLMGLTGVLRGNHVLDVRMMEGRTFNVAEDGKRAVRIYHESSIEYAMTMSARHWPDPELLVFYEASDSIHRLTTYAIEQAGVHSVRVKHISH